MSELQFDYEFIFTSGSFDSTVYNLCTLEDTTGTRLNDVKNVVLEIQRIFTELSGLHIFSTFLQQNQYRYKITVNNINWH
jgi:hypothetical protein